MHYLRFENMLGLLPTALKRRGAGSNPRRGKKKIISFFKVLSADFDSKIIVSNKRVI
jgi:hypothetical protein